MPAPELVELEVKIQQIKPSDGLIVNLDTDNLTITQNHVSSLDVRTFLGIEWEIF